MHSYFYCTKCGFKVFETIDEGELNDLSIFFIHIKNNVIILFEVQKRDRQ